MFRTLFTPLRTRFDLSPRQSPNQLDAPRSPFLQTGHGDESADVINPENFARDVLVELMRNAVERLKCAEDVRSKLETLAEIQRIMLEDAVTKDVFREMDGFIALIGALYTLPIPSQSKDAQGPVQEPVEQIISEATEGTRLTLAIVAEALREHDVNARYFKTRVSYETLSQALNPLAHDPSTQYMTLDAVLSLALRDSTSSGYFTSLTSLPHTSYDARATEFAAAAGTLRDAGASRVLWDLASELCANDDGMRYALYKLLERLTAGSHRAQVLLSAQGLVRPLFDAYLALKPPSASSTPIEKPELNERSVIQRLLRRLLEAGVASTDEARVIFQHAIRKGEEGETLDPEVLEIVRAAMKAKWPAHFSLEGRGTLALLTEEGVKGLPSNGFTLMTWLLVEKLPKNGVATIFGLRLGAGINSDWVVHLGLRPDGTLELTSSGQRESHVFTKAIISRARWAHLTLMWYPHRNTNPSIRVFLDGTWCDAAHRAYPKHEHVAQPGTYVLGGMESPDSAVSWCFASAHLFALPLSDDIPRFVHYLGPRYISHFQSTQLVRFLTYESATALANHLSNASSLPNTPVGGSAPTSALGRVIKDGMGIPETQIVFSLNPFSVNLEHEEEETSWDSLRISIDDSVDKRGWRVLGDVVVAPAYCLDLAVWKLGGAAVPLRLVQLANTAHELSRSLGILTDSLRNSWQNSEDIERLRGYEILTHILKGKAQFINLTSFETLFEFLGMNFKSPESSTITNTLAYRALALDFELWSRTRSEIQQAHLEHFSLLLQASRYKRFNIRQRMAKMGVVRKLLFVLQTEWYASDMVPAIVEAVKVTAQAHFGADEAIKPLLTYLAANLQDEMPQVSTPRSVISVVDGVHSRDKAELVLEALVSIVTSPTHYNKLASALPLTRVCLLLLGDRPTPFIAAHVLKLLSLCLAASSSFARKFELVSGWSILKTVIPKAWDSQVQTAVFDILLGRTARAKDDKTNDMRTVVCPHITPTIFTTLRRYLDMVIGQSQHTGYGTPRSIDSGAVPTSADGPVEALMEELMDLHTNSPTFRQIFRSQQTTQLFVDGFKLFTTSMNSSSMRPATTRMLEKLTHFALALALDPGVAGAQKKEILDHLSKAEALLDAGVAQPTPIDPALVGSDSRSAHRRMLSARLSLQVGERTAIKSLQRIQEWRKTIIKSEKNRLRKNILDLRENNRQVASLNEWVLPLLTERGLWSRTDKVRSWRLDETEGPHRIRKKLEPMNEELVVSHVVPNITGRDLAQVETDIQSVMQLEVPPWAEGYEVVSTTDATEEDRQLAEDIVDDKHRRVRHELEPGDVIDAVNTVARVSGIDSSPGLLILGHTHLYMLDGLVENDDGEVIDAREAPKKLFLIPGSKIELDGPQRAQRWTYEQVGTFSNRTFLFRDVALEIYFKDSRSLLVVFNNQKEREQFNERLSTAMSSFTATTPSTALLKTPLFGKVSARVLSGFKQDGLATAQRKWQAREISNYTYLSIINQISGRTASDATQYPIFPWVIKDYTSDTLDLQSVDTYRDLSRPMGALSDGRRESAYARYTSLASIDEKPFHYGTHFSSSMIVCHFMIRLEPFTHMFKTLQGGHWDLPDRLFSDMNKAFDSASKDSRGDVRELIPEFYTCPEFLENSANLDFGVLQSTGERIHHVKLPPWAKDDPLLFITINREALESDYVSEHLPAWIDLVWGCKQKDPDSYNVFHPLSYEGAIDLDTIADDLEREATVGIIHNFGQTPRKLFQTPHPERYMHGLSTLPLGSLHGVAEDYGLLQRSPRPIKDIGSSSAVCELAIDMVGERIVPCPAGVTCVPNHPHEQVEWSSTRLGKNSEGDLRVVADRKIVQVIESAYATCAAFADSENLVTGSSDYTVRLWRWLRNTGAHSTKEPPVSLMPSHIMRGHSDSVICVTASRPWSIVVSGSKDGTAIVWDLNRGTYIRSISHGSGPEAEVSLVCVNESTGYIATCSPSKLCLHTINGRPITSLQLKSTSPSKPNITSLAFLEREYSRVGVLVTGHRDGTIVLRTWNADNTPTGEKAQWEFTTLRTLHVRDGEGAKGIRGPAVTALKFVGESLYHGEASGKVFHWDFPE